MNANRASADVYGRSKLLVRIEIASFVRVPIKNTIRHLKGSNKCFKQNQDLLKAMNPMSLLC